MSTGQRIIKSLAVAFGLFLTFTIFFSIVGGLYAFTSMFSKDNVIEENTSILLNQSTENIKYLDIDVNSSNLVIKPGNSFIIETNNKHIKYKIDNDPNLDQVFLKGEISNFKAHSRGHFYFTLKDEESRINAVMFASAASKIKFMPQDGMKVLVTGKVSIYPANGGYQIYVSEMLEDGVGNLYIAYEQLKKKLEDEGLFAAQHKKKIPRIPEKIGVITAPTGAAIRDIISTIKRRWPLSEIILFPALVQGEMAKDDIVRQIKRAEEYNLDTLIVGRGGGSIEDLWAFNGGSC